MRIGVLALAAGLWAGCATGVDSQDFDAGMVEEVDGFVQVHDDLGAPLDLQAVPDTQPEQDLGAAPDVVPAQDSSPPPPTCGSQPISLDRFSKAQRTTAGGRTFTGWGGLAQAQKAQKIPVVLVHGNGTTADYWKPLRQYLCQQGYGDREIWAITFQDYSCVGPCSSGSNTEHAAELAQFVQLVRSQTQAKRVNVVAVSMGVTTARYYIKFLGGIKQDEVALAYLVSGPNHGLADCDVPGAALINVSCAELVSTTLLGGWLDDLNSPDETPNGQGDGLPAHRTVIYRTVSYLVDPYFPGVYLTSPQLDGADNLLSSSGQHGQIDPGDLLSYLNKAAPAQ